MSIDHGDIAVIIPTWDMHRALTRCAEMMQLEQRGRAEYVLVLPRAENLPVGEWVNGLDPDDPAIHVIETDLYLSPVEAMAGAGRYLLRYEGNSPSDLFLFIHDDTIIYQQGWDRLILDHFTSHPRCGLAGFGGAIGFAHPDIYKLPYDHRQLARLDFVSNMRDAHLHGRRVTGVCQVAALDGFSLITTREFYQRAGNITAGITLREGLGPWKVGGLWDACLRDGIQYHMYDAWISCRAAELGYETWMLPIDCHHEGGQTSVQRESEYAGVVKRLGYADPQALYDVAHTRIYSRFSRVLPIRINKETT